MSRKSERNVEGKCSQVGPLTLEFQIAGAACPVDYPNAEAIETVKRMIEEGPLTVRRGPGGETLIFCGTKHTAPGIRGVLIALIRTDGVGEA